MISNKINRNNNFFGMKLQKVSNNVSPFAGISFVNNAFNNTPLIFKLQFYPIPKVL
jgi:hypothetical protein